jgi:organic radical activating enzyme
MHERGFEIAIEINGTIVVPPGADWICVSPKAGSFLNVEKRSELNALTGSVN